MAIYYVGKGGSDSNDGSTWALRKLTIDAAVSLATTAGDIVYVGAGTYRETVTLNASGSSGSPITLFGDVTGEYTDGIGGEIVITGSDDDADGDRTNVIAGSSRTYWTFRNITFEAGTGTVIESLGANCSMYDCRVDASDSANKRYGAAFGTSAIIVGCEFINGDAAALGVGTGSRVERCYFEGAAWGVESSGNTVKVYNCWFNYCQFGFVHFGGGLTGAQRCEFYSNVFSNTTGTVAFCSGSDGSTLADGNVQGPGASYSGITATNNTTNLRRCTLRGTLFRRLSGRGPLIGGVGAHSTEEDPAGAPDGIGADDVGPIRYAPLPAVGSTGTVFSEPGYVDYEISVEHNVAFTIVCDVEWSGAITSKPQLILKARYGITVQTDTATGSGSSEPLSVGGTPSVPGGGNGNMIVRIYAPEVGSTVTLSGLEVA